MAVRNSKSGDSSFATKFQESAYKSSIQPFWFIQHNQDFEACKRKKINQEQTLLLSL